MNASAHAADAAPSIEKISARYLGRPYSLGKLGEGADGKYDQDPLSRTDRFDCQTYVETVMAEALSRGPEDFATTMNAVRYRDGQVTYFDRNHFPESDWIPNNTHAGFIADITAEVSPTLVRTSHVYIDKPGWIRALTVAAIQIPGLDESAKVRRLAELRMEGSGIPGVAASVPYLPLAVAMRKEIQDRIPSGSVLSVVRENWYPAGEGTGMAISHMGFAIRKNGILYYRNASTTEMRVVDQTLTNYLEKYRKSKTIKGIHLLQVKQEAR